MDGGYEDTKVRWDGCWWVVGGGRREGALTARMGGRVICDGPPLAAIDVVPDAALDKGEGTGG
jgi:hypothetical protein